MLSFHLLTFNIIKTIQSKSDGFYNIYRTTYFINIKIIYVHKKVREFIKMNDEIKR